MDSLSASLRIDQSGSRPVIVKEAPHGPAADRLRAEAAVLRAAAHPGVVSLVDFSDTLDGVVLRTRFCGSRTLANVSGMTVQRAAGIIAALAATVADLHDLGICHGRISADHVLVASDGRPVLCGLAEATTDATADHIASDVSGLGTLLHELLAPLDNSSPLPASRLGRKGAWNGYQRRGLLNLADQASADDPFIRPTARQFAHNVRATVPDASLHDSTGHDEDTNDAIARRTDEREQPSRRLAIAGFSAAALVLAVLGAALLMVPAEGAAPRPAATPIDASEPADDAPRETLLPPSPPISTTTSIPVADEASADSLSEGAGSGGPSGCGVVDGGVDDPGPAAQATTSDGHPCPAELRLAEGVLEIDGEEFHIGLSPAAVAIGDFACDGELQAAIVDLTDGHVFVFDRWAGDDDAVTAQALRQVEGARRLLAEPTGSGNCHRLVALDSFGLRHVISPTTSQEP